MKPKAKTRQPAWFLYIIHCSDGTFYTGITKDLKRRLNQHILGKGAKYTRARGAVEIIYSKRFKTHRDAAAREIAIKRLSRLQKQKLINSRLKAKAHVAIA